MGAGAIRTARSSAATIRSRSSAVWSSASGSDMIRPERRSVASSRPAIRASRKAGISWSGGGSTRAPRCCWPPPPRWPRRARPRTGQGSGRPATPGSRGALGGEPEPPRDRRARPPRRAGRPDAVEPVQHGQRGRRGPFRELGVEAHLLDDDAVLEPEVGQASGAGDGSRPGQGEQAALADAERLGGVEGEHLRVGLGAQRQTLLGERPEAGGRVDEQGHPEVGGRGGQPSETSCGGGAPNVEQASTSAVRGDPPARIVSAVRCQCLGRRPRTRG